MTAHAISLNAYKLPEFEQAEQQAIRITQGDHYHGKLVPAGEWVFTQPALIESMMNWRRRAMRMFMTQFTPSISKTEQYLANSAIADASRLFFFLYDENDELVGHMGIAGYDGERVELDNVMRGQSGGDPRLIYHAEVALLHWSFATLGIESCDVRLLSYNWLVFDLHEEVGFKLLEQRPLKKTKDADFINHQVVDESEANVNYHCSYMVLSRDDFYNHAGSSLSRS